MYQPQKTEQFFTEKRQLVACRDCSVYNCNIIHVCAPGSNEAIEFFARHKNCRGRAYLPTDAGLLLAAKRTGADTFSIRESSLVDRFGRPLARIVDPADVRDNSKIIEFWRDAMPNCRGNASIKQAFGGEVAMDLTSLNSLAGSTTAGWQSAYVDNSANLYLDALFYGKFATGGTAGGQKQIMFFLYGASNTSDFPNTGAASGGTTGASSSVGGALTFLDVTTNLCNLPTILILPTLTSSIAYVTPATSLMAQLQGPLMPYWGLGLINQANWTFAASSNALKYDPVYYTVI